MKLPWIERASFLEAAHIAHFIGSFRHMIGTVARDFLKRGLDAAYLIDDSYSNDLASLRIALDFMVQQGGSHQRAVILSDILQSAVLQDISDGRARVQLFIPGVLQRDPGRGVLGNPALQNTQ